MCVAAAETSMFMKLMVDNFGVCQRKVVRRGGRQRDEDRGLGPQTGRKLCMRKVSHDEFSNCAVAFYDWTSGLGFA